MDRNIMYGSLEGDRAAAERTDEATTPLMANRSGEVPSTLGTRGVSQLGRAAGVVLTVAAVATMVVMGGSGGEVSRGGTPTSEALVSGVAFSVTKNGHSKLKSHHSRKAIKKHKAATYGGEDDDAALTYDASTGAVIATGELGTKSDSSDSDSSSFGVSSRHKHSCGKGCEEYDDDDDGPSPTMSPAPTSSPSYAPSTLSPTMAPSSAAPSSSPTSGSPTIEPTSSMMPSTTSPSPAPSKTFAPTTEYQLESEYDDDSLYRLACSEFDDDGVYPSHFCNYGDTKTCLEHVQYSDAYEGFCGDTCSNHDMKLHDNGDYNTKDYNGSSWAVVCGWEAVKHMNETCDGSFVPDLKEAKAADAWPNYTYSTAPSDSEVDGEKMDACNLHAFCSVCSYEGGTKIHKNCKAHVDKYGTGSLYDLTTFFNSLDSFWCTDDVQGAIHDGSFKRTYGA